MRTEQKSEYQDDLEYSVAPFLLKDFLSRYWWVILVIMLIGFPKFNDDLIVNPVHVVIMMLMGPLIVAQDRKRYIWPIYKVLPLSNHELSRILWLEGVAIFPLIYLVWNLIVLLFNLKLTETPPSFNIVNVLITVSALTFLEIGYSSLMMLFLPYLPDSENDNFRIEHILAGVMWGLLVIVPIFSFGLFIHFKIIEHNILWGSALLLTCPVLISLSYFFRGGLLKETYEKVMPYRWVTPVYPSSKTSFWFQFWIQQYGVVIIGMICCLVLATIVNLILNQGELKYGISLIFFSFLMFVIPAFSVIWGNDIRALRTLPMTTRKLGYFLLAIPAINILCITILMISFNLGAGRIQSILELVWAFIPAIYALCLSIIVLRLTLSYGKQRGITLMFIVFSTFIILWPIYLFLIPIAGLMMFPGIKRIVNLKSETYRYSRWSGIEDYLDKDDDVEEDLLLTQGIAYCPEENSEKEVQ